MEDVIIHYGELALKGGNRDFFEISLLRDIKEKLDERDFVSVRRLYGRILVRLSEKAKKERVCDSLLHVFGIENFSFVYRTEQDIEKIGRDVLPYVLEAKKEQQFETFCVRTQRGNKDLPFTSVEVNKQVGAYLLKNGIDTKVKLKGADLNVYIELFEKDAYFYFEKIAGLGGMPTGTAGKVLVLLSSGFDSPVAAFKMMRRGAKCAFVHFHSYPYTNKASQENVKKIVKFLERYQGESKVHMIPFAEIQKEIRMKAPEALRVVLYRRYMIRMAENLVGREKALALVTGDSLAQVASQTLRNMQVISQAATLPLLRPLIGMDKKEIIDLSRELGLYEICSQPYDDCCSLFTPKHPTTAAKLDEVLEVEGKLFIG